MSERVPEDWHKFKIGSLISEISEKTKISNQHEVLSVTKDGIQPQIEYFKKQIASKDNSGYKIVRKGHLVFGTMNLWMGSLDVLKKIDIGIVSPAYKIFEFNANHCLINFMSYFMRTPHMIGKYVLHSQQGASIVRRNLDLDQLLADEVVLPSLPEQKKIASILTSVDEVIENTQKQIDKLQDLKKATMNELLTKGIGHTEFKDSELGRIPKSWKITELSIVSKILSSNVDKKTIKNETPVLLCNYMDVYNNLKITREINFMKASAKKNEINKFLIEKDDVIITKDSETPDDIAISSYVSEDFDNVLCGYHLSIIRSNKLVLDGKFLSLFFKLDYIRNRFSVLANGTTRFGLNLKEIENSKILLPSLEEQKKIANIIFSLDDTISTITKKFNKYIFLKKSLMQDLLTGKVRVSVN